MAEYEAQVQAASLATAERWVGGWVGGSLQPFVFGFN